MVTAPRMATPTDQPSTQNASKRTNIRSKTVSTSRVEILEIVDQSIAAKMTKPPPQMRANGHIRRCGSARGVRAGVAGVVVAETDAQASRTCEPDGLCHLHLLSAATGEAQTWEPGV